MLRIGQVEATATQDGKYTDGSVAGGIAATRLRAAAFNAMQEELAHIVESAGLALDINDMTQVLKAIQKLTLSRANPFADIKSDGAAAISTALTNLGLAIDQIAQSGLSFLKVIYCLAQLFRVYPIMCSRPAVSCNLYLFPA